MMKQLFFFTSIVFSTTSYNMLLDSFNPLLKSLRSKSLSRQEKQAAVRLFLNQGTTGLSFRDAKALQLTGAIFLPKKKSKTLIHDIVQCNHKEVLYVALTNGFSKYVNVYKDDNTPLYIAAKKGYSDLIPLLLKAKADVNAQNEQKKTALMGAVLCLQTHDPFIEPADVLNTIKVLKEAGADITIPDENQKTIENYIAEILTELEEHRKRTKFNEIFDLEETYQKISNLLKE